MRAIGTLLTTTAVALAGWAVPAHAATPAEGTVVGADAPGVIPGRYIVRTRSGGVTAQGLGDAGGQTYTKSMTAQQARRLAASPDVQFVEQDRILHIEATTQKNPVWGLDRIDQRKVTASRTFTPTDDGSDVHAYVVDTGIRVTHSQFGGRATYGYNAVGDAGAYDADDCNGHGTHVAGTIGGSTYGVAKHVKLVAVRVLNCKGEGTLSDVLEGIDWVTEHAAKPAVANMSLGGGSSRALNAAVQDLIDSGVTVTVAAGNENINAAKESPANLPAAITVAASDSKDRRASFSNYGSVVDLFAPGVNIRSAYAGSDTASAIASGTSMASPHVAGAAALVLDAAPGLTPLQVRNYLVKNATTGKVSGLKGSPNRLLFVTAPPAAPVIGTGAITVTTGKAYAGKLALKSARRGTWSLVGGALPAGLTLSAAGVIAGTPTAPGTATVVARFIDYVPSTTNRTIQINVVKTTPLITTAALTDGTTGTWYAQQLTLGDTRSGSWSLAAGALPAGLTLSTTGLITGTPETPGTESATFAFTDGWGTTGSKTLTLTVN